MRVLILLLCTSVCFANGFYADRERGYYWGEAFVKPKAAKKNLTPTKQRKVLQQRVQTIIDTALMQPNNKQAVADLLKVQLLSFNQAQQVVNTARLLLLEQPQYDFLRTFPVNHEARLLYNQTEQEKTKTTIQGLTKNHGLVFFFSARCPACKLMAKNLKNFARKYQFDILPVKMTRETLPEFPDALLNNGMSYHYKVAAFPTTYLVNPKTGKSFAIANRLASISELEDAILQYLKAGVIQGEFNA